MIQAFVAHLGHDDLARATADDLVARKDVLLATDIANITVCTDFCLWQYFNSLSENGIAKPARFRAPPGIHALQTLAVRPCSGNLIRTMRCGRDGYAPVGALSFAPHGGGAILSAFVALPRVRRSVRSLAVAGNHRPSRGYRQMRRSE